jgi:hypothetical protein
MCNLYRGTSIDASYPVSVHLAKRFQRRRFSFKLTYQKQELPVVAMFVNGSGRNCNLYRRTSIDAPYQVFVHLTKRFRGEDFVI